MHPQLDPPTEAPVPLESRVRFSLRGIFIGTAVTAAALAALAPWFRQWDEAEQRHFLVFWSNATLGAAAAAAIACMMRVRLERRAGRAYYRLPRSASKYACFCTGSVFQCAALGVWLSFQSSRLGSGPFTQWSFFDWIAISIGSILASHSLSAFWHTGLEICENGLIANGVMFTWKFILSYRWAASDPRLLLIQCRHSLLSVSIGGTDKHLIALCLNRSLAATPQPPD